MCLGARPGRFSRGAVPLPSRRSDSRPSRTRLTADTSPSPRSPSRWRTISRRRRGSFCSTRSAGGSAGGGATRWAPDRPSRTSRSRRMAPCSPPPSRATRSCGILASGGSSADSRSAGCRRSRRTAAPSHSARTVQVPATRAHRSRCSTFAPAATGRCSLACLTTGSGAWRSLPTARRSPARRRMVCMSGTAPRARSSRQMRQTPAPGPCPRSTRVDRPSSPASRTAASRRSISPASADSAARSAGTRPTRPATTPPAWRSTRNPT